MSIEVETRTLEEVDQCLREVHEGRAPHVHRVMLDNMTRWERAPTLYYLLPCLCSKPLSALLRVATPLIFLVGPSKDQCHHTHSQVFQLPFTPLHTHIMPAVPCCSHCSLLCTDDDAMRCLLAGSMDHARVASMSPCWSRPSSGSTAPLIRRHLGTSHKKRCALIKGP